MAEPTEAGQIVETTTRRRTLSADVTRKTPEFWEYLASIPENDWGNHILYLYRVEPGGPIPGRGLQVGKFVDTSVIPWNDEDEATYAIAQKFGGRIFRVIVKRLSQKITEGRISVDAPVKNITERIEPNSSGYSSGVSVQPAGEYGATARVAETAINTIASQEKQAVEIGISALANAANIMKNFSEKPTSGPMDELQRTFMSAMVQRMTAPPPDPLESFTRMLALVRELNGSGGGNGIGGTVVDKVLSAVVDRGLNPQPSGPAVSAGAELMRTLPTVAAQIVTGVHDYRLAMEAQRDMVLSGARTQPTPSAPPPTTHPQVLPPTSSPASPAQTQPPNGAAPMTDVMAFIESKIVEILQEPQSAEAAAEEAIDFLDRMDATIVPQLASQGEPGLLALFQTRPMLKPATANLPRLQEFVRAFLKYASEGTDPSLATKPN